MTAGKVILFIFGVQQYCRSAAERLDGVVATKEQMIVDHLEKGVQV
jgi:hypothetical protein